jgi:hypothetical protein
LEYTEIMKPSLTVLVLCPWLALSAWSQPTPFPVQPLSQVQQYLGLTDSQVSAILQNNNDYATFSFQQQRQIQNAQSQIAVETAKDQLDPIALGTLYAGIESACRDLRDRAATSQKQNISVLTDAQRTKLGVLNDAIKLAPIISEAQSGNLLGSVGFSPVLFISSFGNTIGGITGYPAIFGCGGPGVSIFRSGDFSSVLPTDGNATQLDRNFGASPDPAKGSSVGVGNPRVFPHPNK